MVLAADISHQSQQSFGDTGVEAAIDWTLPGFIILLPSALLLFLAFRRREEAQRDLATGKAMCTTCC